MTSHFLYQYILCVLSGRLFRGEAGGTNELIISEDDVINDYLDFILKFITHVFLQGSKGSNVIILPLDKICFKFHVY